MTSPTSRSKELRYTGTSRFTTGLAIFAVAFGCNAAPDRAASTTNTQISELGFQNPSQVASQTELAREWGLTPQEWTRYQTLMAGPRGIYSPGLDPLTALGIEAKSAEERRRYAELQVQAERQRIDKELAYQRAYDQAFARLYPNEKVIQISSGPTSPAGSGTTTALKGTGRLAVFVQDSCTACIARVKDLQTQKQPFDLYFVGTEVAAAVGNSMFSDLVSVAGHIYKFGIDDGLPGASGGKVAINVHADEFNELMGDEFIPMINKGGGAGMQVTAYTQTMSDIEAKIGNRAKAGQVIGNFNNLFMLRVRETATAELLTNQLPKVQVFTSTPASSANDAINGKTAFTSNMHVRVLA